MLPASSPVAAALADARAAGRPAYRVAADAGIDRKTLSRIAAGHQRPHRLTREAIARALDRDVDDLFAVVGQGGS